MKSKAFWQERLAKVEAEYKHLSRRFLFSPRPPTGRKKYSPADVFLYLLACKKLHWLKHDSAKLLRRIEYCNAQIARIEFKDNRYNRRPPV